MATAWPPTSNARRSHNPLRWIHPGCADRRRSETQDGAILIVEYPTPAAFIDMVTSAEYAKVHEHRRRRIDRGDSIATSVWSVAD